MYKLIGFLMILLSVLATWATGDLMMVIAFGGAGIYLMTYGAKYAKELEEE